MLQVTGVDVHKCPACDMEKSLFNTGLWGIIGEDYYRIAKTEDLPDI
jgi:hypothetical protein